MHDAGIEVGYMWIAGHYSSRRRLDAREIRWGGDRRWVSNRCYIINDDISTLKEPAHVLHAIKFRKRRRIDRRIVLFYARRCYFEVDPYSRQSGAESAINNEILDVLLLQKCHVLGPKL